MQLEGGFTVSHPPHQVYDILADPRRLVRCLPDLQSYEIQDAEHFTITVRVGISHLRGPATLRLEVVEKEAPRYAKLVGRGSGLGSTVTLETSFTLEETDTGGTQVWWKAAANIMGPIVSLAGGLLEPVARVNIERLVKALATAVGEGSSATERGPL